VGDVYGRNRMFNVGFGVFTFGSLLCGFSNSISLLTAFRAVQAVGGALMQANAGAIIADVFPRNARGRAFGFSALGWTSGSMLGIVLDGVITTFIGWQYIFFINIPIGIIAVFLGLRYLKEVAKTTARIDSVGIVLLGCSLSLLSYGLMSFAAEGLTAFNLILTLAGATLIPVFIFYDRKLVSPTIDFLAFKNRVLRNACLSTFFVSVGYLSVAFLVIMYIHGIRGLSPLNAPLLLIPRYVAGSLLGP
jgi:MFS family permease